MSRLPHGLRPEDMKELIFVILLFKIAEEKSLDELNEMTAKEVVTIQPALRDTVQFLYSTKMYDVGQMEVIIRMFVVVWWFYKEKLPTVQPKIDEKLYRTKMHNNTLWFEGFKGLNDERTMIRWTNAIKQHSARCLYSQMFNRCIDQPVDALKELPYLDRAFLLNSLTIVLDCMEDIVKRASIEKD